VIGRFVQVAIGAVNRGDLETTFILYDPRVEFVAEALEGLGFEGVYRGIQARVDWQRRWVAEWGDFQFLPEEVIYVGQDRFFFVGRVVGSGLSSGAEFDNFWANALEVRAGRIFHEHFYFDRAAAGEAMKAAGVEPDW
jgi:ketosteroid isomerase-like protein